MFDNLFPKDSATTAEKDVHYKTLAQLVIMCSVMLMMVGCTESRYIPALGHFCTGLGWMAFCAAAFLYVLASL